MAPVGANTAKKKRGRPPGSRNSNVAPKAASKKAAAVLGKKRKGRKPHTATQKASSTAVESIQTSKRKGRPRRDSEDEASGSAIATTGNSATKRRGRPQQNDDDELAGNNEDEHERSSQRRKRKTPAEADDLAQQPPKSKRIHMQLESKTKKISQDEIETWPQMTQQVLVQILDVIGTARNDIANTQRDERKSMAAHNTLNPLIKKLAKQLQRSRMPLGAKEYQFNSEKLNERNQTMTRDVTTARHMNMSLSDQVKVAEQMLKKEEDNLEDLKRDTRKWRQEWKERENRGRLHPLLKTPKIAATHGDKPEDIALRDSTHSDILSFETSDEDLTPLVEQLRRSLESLQNNHAQIGGIYDAMTVVQTGLDDVLFRNTTAEQYSSL